jgi:hypothetical protein
MSIVQMRKVADANIFVYPQEPGTDDASDMYVMSLDSMGVSVLVRMVTDEDADGNPVARPKIMVEAGGVFLVGVNDDVNVYGEEA